MANKDCEAQRILIERMLKEKYKPSMWNRFKDAVGIFFLSCFILLCIGTVVFLVAILIENPLSLAIICGTILLIWMWRNR